MQRVYARGLFAAVALAGVAGCSAERVSTASNQPPSRSAVLAHAEAERLERPDLAAYAWGSAERVRVLPRKKWPVTVLSIGHTTASYQNYGDGSPYFHHGLDIRADAGSPVIASAGGKVINVDNYMGGEAYWEVVIQDDNGYVWQYHHVDHDSITQEVMTAFQNHGRVEEGTKLGEVFYWDVVTFGERYHHTHLNILGEGGKYLSAFDFLEPLPDTQVPQFVDVGLVKNGNKVNGTTVSGQYTVYATIHDLIMHQKFVVPPHKIVTSIDGGAPTTVWEFSELPGGASESQYLNDFFVPKLTCGDYECRKLSVNLGFNKEGTHWGPTTHGAHKIDITASDYQGNSATKSFSWQVQ